MPRTIQAWLAFITSVLLALITAAPVAITAEQAFDWQLPSWMPAPLVPNNNPMSAAKVELGRYLFYDPRLSVTGDFSCASCHQQALAFTDGKPVAIGATGEHHSRNSQSLANVAYLPVLTWANPLLHDLAQQAVIPMFGETPVELGLAGQEYKIFTMLRQDAEYPQRFKAAFPSQADAINLSNLTKALAAFQRTLISVNSPYDRYRYGNEEQAISEAAKRGEALFFSERLECFHCHGGLHFTDSIIHARSSFEESAFHNTGLYNIDGQGAYPPLDTGLHALTLEASDMGHFRTPSLRNVAVTAPYMHDGSIPTLAEVIDHYAAGGRTLNTGPYAGSGYKSPHKSEFVKGFKLNEQARQDLIAFLESLTDQHFLSNPAFSDPH